jgi:hypothetical protein
VRRAGLAIAIAGLLAGACGEPAIPRAVSRQLQDQVATIREAVEEGRVFGARQRLGKLTAEVGRLMDDGLIGAGTEMEILDAAESVRANLTLVPTATSPTETTTTPSPEEGGDEGNAYGKDKDKNEDKGHGND